MLLEVYVCQVQILAYLAWTLLSVCTLHLYAMRTKMEPISFYGMQTRLDASMSCPLLLTTISNHYFSFNIRLSGAIDFLIRHSLRGGCTTQVCQWCSIISYLLLHVQRSASSKQMSEKVKWVSSLLFEGHELVEHRHTKHKMNIDSLVFWFNLYVPELIIARNRQNQK